MDFSEQVAWQSSPVWWCRQGKAGVCFSVSPCGAIEKRRIDRFLCNLFLINVRTMAMKGVVTYRSSAPLSIEC